VIYKLVIVNSGSLEDAQDLMQDTLVVVIKNIRNPDFTLTSSLSTYLYAIANNIWLMELKRRKKNKDVPPKMLVLEEDNSEEEQFKINLIIKALNNMGEKCKTILMESYYKKTPHKEIAELLEVKPASIKVMKNRCVKKLRACF